MSYGSEHELRPSTNNELYGISFSRTPEGAKDLLAKVGFDRDYLDEFHIVALGEDAYKLEVQEIGGDFLATYGNRIIESDRISFAGNIQSKLYSGEKKIPIYVRQNVFASDESLVQNLAHEIFKIEELRYVARQPISKKSFLDQVGPNGFDNIHYNAVLEGDDTLRAFREIYDGQY